MSAGSMASPSLPGAVGAVVMVRASSSLASGSMRLGGAASPSSGFSQRL